MQTKSKASKILCVLLCLIMAFGFLGCWDKREPKRLAVVLSIIYDLSDDGRYKVVVEYLNPSAKIGSGGSASKGGVGDSPSVTKTSFGETIPEAVRQVTEGIERSVFGGHNKVRFFSEKFARRDIVTIMDFFLRDYITDEHSLIVVIKGDKPEEIYNPKIALSESTGRFISNMKDAHKRNLSKSVFVTTLDFIRDLFNEGKSPVAGLVEIRRCEDQMTGDMQGFQAAQNEDEEGNRQIKVIYEGLAAFKDNKLVGFFDGEEARAYNILVNKFGTSYMGVPTGLMKTVVKVVKAKSKIKPLIKDDKISFDVDVQAKVEVIQEEGKLHSNEYPGVTILENEFSKQLKDEIHKAVKKAQTEFQSDIFGFGAILRVKYPKTWKNVKEQWNEIFSDTEININVKTSVVRAGKIKHPAKREAT